MTLDKIFFIDPLTLYIFKNRIYNLILRQRCSNINTKEMGIHNSKCMKIPNETNLIEEKSDERKEEDVEIDNIKNIVTDILKKKNANLTFLPDSIEAEIYENILLIAIEHVKKVLSTTRIEFLGHEITLNIKPL